MATAHKLIAMIRKSIQSDPRVKDEDFSDAIREAERKGDHMVLFREYTRRAAAVKPPDYSGMSEAERTAEAGRLREEALREAQAAGHSLAWRQTLEAEARLLDFDPKQRGRYYNRVLGVEDIATFDHDEESPLGPMRFTDKVYQSEREVNKYLRYAINIFSVKIACSDVGFPIHVYGTVIARDSTDQKCLYLFRRDKDHSQLINSEDESLILTGPKRGIMLLDDNYVEIDLKIKDHHGQEDRGRDFSKGFFTIRGCRTSEKCTVESKSLATRLSTVDMMYAVVRRAVEATIAVEVLRGDFYGEITAYTSSIRNSLVLYDSKLAGAITFDSKGEIQLMRSVLCVCLEDMLMLSIVSWSGDGNKFERTIEFTPRVNRGEEDVVYVGAISMHVKVTWSVMDL